HDGNIVREGTPADVWANPGSAWLAEVFGLGNVIEGTVTNKNKVQTKFGDFVITCEHKHQEGDMVHLLARPLPTGKARVATGGNSQNEANLLQGIVKDVIFRHDRFK